MSQIVISDGLLNEAKDYLGITWDDETGDNTLRAQLRRGIAYIAEKTGVEKTASAFDADGDDRAQELLFNYLLYDRAGSLNQFVENYAPEINSLRRKNEVKRYEAGAGG